MAVIRFLHTITLSLLLAAAGVMFGASLLHYDPAVRLPFNAGTNVGTWQWYAAADTNEIRVFTDTGELIPQYDEPNGSAHASLLEAWTIQPHAIGQTVAIIDTGLHGALVASVVGAPHDGVDIEGIAPGVEVLTYDVPSYSAVAVSTVISNLPLRVMAANLSFGYVNRLPPTNVLAAMRYRSNILFTLAAHNGTVNQDAARDWLCNERLPNAMCITARTHGDQIFGAYGVTNVTLAGDGRRVPADDHSWPFPASFIGPLNDDVLGEPRVVWSVTGTSFAAPEVAGAAALVRARYPNDTPQQTIARLCAGADRSEYWATRTKCGTLNIARSLTVAIAPALRIDFTGLLVSGLPDSVVTLLTSTNAGGPWEPWQQVTNTGWPVRVPVDMNEQQRFWKL